MERIEKEYMPLSGSELLEVIFERGKKEAAKYEHHFGNHLAFHNPKCQLAIKVECYTPEGAMDAGGFELVVPLGDRITEPDRVRDELGLGTLETRLVDEPSGTLADVRVGKREIEIPELDKEKVLAKVDRLLGEKKPTVKKKGGKGWPKGKSRGPKKEVAVDAQSQTGG